MLKTAIIAAVALSALGSVASAQYLINRGMGGYGIGSNPSHHYVPPSTTPRGQLRDGYFRTNPNHTEYDNFGTRGNYNPYTGQFGRRIPRW